MDENFSGAESVHAAAAILPVPPLVIPAKGACDREPGSIPERLSPGASITEWTPDRLTPSGVTRGLFARRINERLVANLCRFNDRDVKRQIYGVHH